ncbi:unnamed protein product [Ascophyllum nodosum]
MTFPRPPPGGRPGGDNKRQPELAPIPPKRTRTIPEPLLLHQRRLENSRGESSCSTDDGGQAEAGGSSKASKRDGVEEDKCIICLNNLPDVGRGVVSCGHVFCFICVHTWLKQQSTCPLCSAKVKSIVKTLTDEEIARLQGREEKSEKGTRKERWLEKKRQKKRKRDFKTYEGGVMTKTIRIRRRDQSKRTRLEARDEPHPQAPGGVFHNNPGAVAAMFRQSVRERLR